MLKTEMRNPETKNIDKMDVMQILQTINKENMNAVNAVGNVLDDIGRACNAIINGFNKGGRLFYMGAGTSGRLGVADAAECPPTFGVSKDMVVGIIAGGKESVFSASENSEDDEAAGIRDIKQYCIKAEDTLVGISAAGNAAYILGAVNYAKKVGCTTVGITCNAGSRLDAETDISIVTDTGAEVITGSTRMKAGTAQKLVLNMLSTVSMIKTGKVYENLMINLRPSNEKLKRRMVEIVKEIVQCDDTKAVEMLDMNEWNIIKSIESVGKF